jgi:hypothetical protein
MFTNTNKYFELEFSFVIDGDVNAISKPYADGLALWYTKSKDTVGDLYGNT